MIIIAGALYCEPQAREAYLASVADVAALARKARGCLDFVQAADPIDPSRINIFERWESDEDVEAFRASGDPAAPATETPALTGAEVQKYRIAAVENP